jgi:hypothetical protein
LAEVVANGELTVEKEGQFIKDGDQVRAPTAHPAQKPLQIQGLTAVFRVFLKGMD